jgi:hypothetical protein
MPLVTTTNINCFPENSPARPKYVGEWNKLVCTKRIFIMCAVLDLN